MLSEIRLVPGKKNCWNGIQIANIPIVIVAIVSALGSNIKMTEAGNLDILSTGIVSANVKSNHTIKIVGMKRIYVSIGGFQT